MMVNKCGVIGCSTNYLGHSIGAVFRLPKNEYLRSRWIKFLNRNDIYRLKTVYICVKHFDEKYLKRNENRVRLINYLLPVPTIKSSTPVRPRIPSIQRYKFKSTNIISCILRRP